MELTVCNRCGAILNPDEIDYLKDKGIVDVLCSDCLEQRSDLCDDF